MVTEGQAFIFLSRDEVAEERGVRRKRHMSDMEVQGLILSEYELGHATSIPHAVHPQH